ncbi:MAG: DUF6801 domain-containing protein [Streptosporangiaceae bacterium]
MRRRTGGWLRRAGPAGSPRPSSRGAYRVAAVAVVVVAAGVTAGSAAAVGQQAVSLRLGYTCAFASGSRPVTTQITATYPATATTGKPVEATGTGITVTLPHRVAAELARSHAATVSLTAGLATEVTEKGTTPATALWRNFQSPTMPVPATGPLTLTASGPASSLTATAAGEVTVSATDLSLLLTAHTADGHPASPASLSATCVPSPGQDATLATITAAGATTKTPQSAVSRKNNPAKCIPFPKKLILNPAFPLPKPPAGVNVIHHPQVGCSYAGGFTNAARLGEAVLVGPGLTDLHLGLTSYTKFTSAYGYFSQRVAAQLEYQGKAELPPARNTLLAFGFMPVSATLQLSEIGPLNAALISCSPGKKPCPDNPANEALFYGLVTLRIYNVDINGVPLNVGQNCHTETPFDLGLIGVPPSYIISSIQGVLTGTVKVPDFTGCNDGSESLDPIFDATVSGPGNFVKITQAPFCTPQVTGKPGCPPVGPIPKH